MRIIFATWLLAEYQGRILNEEFRSNRLISYWEIKDKKSELLRQYVKNGKVSDTKTKVIVNGVDVTASMPRTAARLAEMRAK